MEFEKNPSWDHADHEEKNRQLYLKQKAMLDLFLQKGAISRTQHDRSLGDLREKMHF